MDFRKGHFQKMNPASTVLVLLAVFHAHADVDINNEPSLMTIPTGSDMEDQIEFVQNFLANISDFLQNVSVSNDNRLNDIYHDFMTNLIDISAEENNKDCLNSAFNGVHDENFRVWGRLQSAYQPLSQEGIRISNYIQNGEKLKNSSNESSQTEDFMTQWRIDVTRFQTEGVELQRQIERLKGIYINLSEKIIHSYKKFSDQKKKELDSCLKSKISNNLHPEEKRIHNETNI